MHASTRVRSAFSLIELVIVVVIIGIIAAIAIPRMSRGAAGASSSTLTANLAVLRKAIDLYAAEHNNTYPTDNTTITNQLVQYTDAAGTVSATKTGAFIYGPYIQSIPKLPVGANKGASTFAASQTGTAGWVYVGHATGGGVSANCPTAEKDDANVSFNLY